MNERTNERTRTNDDARLMTGYSTELHAGDAKSSLARVSRSGVATLGLTSPERLGRVHGDLETTGRGHAS